MSKIDTSPIVPRAKLSKKVSDAEHIQFTPQYYNEYNRMN